MCVGRVRGYTGLGVLGRNRGGGPNYYVYLFPTKAPDSLISNVILDTHFMTVFISFK